MNKFDIDKLYSEEISLITSPEFSDYIEVNLRKVKEFRKNFEIPIIGITGTEGKTTTKRMLSSILVQRGPVLETPLDCTSASVVTSTLLKLNHSYNYAVVELGIINRNQFKLAVEIAQPNAGIVTNIGEAHLPGVGDKYIIADAKVDLIRNLPPDGFAILNIDDELVSGMEAFCPSQRVIKYGLNAKAHFGASKLKYLGPEGMEFFVNNYYKFRLPIYSSTSVSNALAAIATARALGFEFEEIISGLEKNFEMLSGRGNLIDLGDIFILDYTYNATVNAVTKACESLVNFKKFSKNLILVLGDLENLGQLSLKIHKSLGYYISALPINVVLTVGEDARYVGEGIHEINHNRKIIEHCQIPENISEQLIKYIDSHTTILIIGGKSLKLHQSLQNLVQIIQSL